MAVWGRNNNKIHWSENIPSTLIFLEKKKVSCAGCNLINFLSTCSFLFSSFDFLVHVLASLNSINTLAIAS